MPLRPCNCGSGLHSEWRYDARGIELCRTCHACHAEKMRRYRPEVLTDANYEADEAIEPDGDDYASRAEWRARR